MGDAGEVESTGAQGDDDLFQFLELKRKEVAAMTQAAEIAREQALQLLRLQQEAARIDRLAEGSEGEGGITQDATFRQARSSGGDTLVESTALGSVGELPLTTLSLEDRQRFGLDVTPPPSEVPPSRSETVQPEVELTTTVRFEEAVPAEQVVDTEAPKWSSLSTEDRQRFGLETVPGTGAYPPSRHGAGRASEAMNLGRLSHPDVLWGNAGTPGPPSMAKTMAQLEAVGMASNLLQLEESERKLQRLKLAG